MGFFEKSFSQLLKKKLEERNYTYIEEVLSEDLDNYINEFGSERLFEKIVLKLANANLVFSVNINYLLKIYKIMCNDPNSLEQENNFIRLVGLYVNFPELFLTNKNLFHVNAAFSNRICVTEYFNYLLNNEELFEDSNIANISRLVDYLVEARKYYVDDQALLSSAIALVKKCDPVLIKYGSEEEVLTYVKNQLIKDRKACDIVDIDMQTLRELEDKIIELTEARDSLDKLLQSATAVSNSLNSSVDGIKTELSESRKKELEKLKKEANRALKEASKTYNDLLNEQRKAMSLERDSILAEVDRIVSEYLVKIASAADVASQRVDVEMGRIHTASQKAITSINGYLSDNGDIKKVIQDTADSKEILQRLAHIEKATADSGIKVVGSKPIVVPEIIISSEDRSVDGKVNYFFDKRVPYKERLKRLLEAKEKDISENGTIYHEKFDDVLAMIIQNDTPYLYGPSGCGKSHMVKKQVTGLLRNALVTNGYVLYEQDVLGYRNSGTGAYVPSNFYRCYKYGDMIFFDELDNGDANATVVLNSFTDGSADESYIFPNGEAVSRHPNFRMIAAGNTKGNGMTLAHNTRAKMDESVAQRLTPVEIGYDNRIEERILKDYPDWYNFAVNFRKAIEAIPSEAGDDVNAVGTFTTRDASTIKKHKDDESLTDEQLMEYQIIETKDTDYLNRIYKKMVDGGNFTKGGRRLLDIYKSKIDKQKCKRK